jgi:hypothetical protein
LMLLMLDMTSLGEEAKGNEMPKVAKAAASQSVSCSEEQPPAEPGANPLALRPAMAATRCAVSSGEAPVLTRRRCVVGQRTRCNPRAVNSLRSRT